MVLCGLVICGMYKIHAQNMYQTYEIDSQTFLIDFYSPMELMGKITENIYDDIRELQRKIRKSLTMKAIWSILITDCQEKLSELVVRKNGVYTYQSEVLKGKNIDELLPAYDEDENICDVALYKGGDYQTLVKQINFSDSQGNEYSVSILTSLNQIVPQLKMFAIELFAAVFLILVITSLILNLWIYRSVVTPLNKLKLATHNIQAGNFDFEMPNVPKNEIGDVCRDFEEMRVILKQSSEDKIRSDMEEKELIRNISHDLKTPIALIQTYGQSVKDDIYPYGDKNSSMDVILENANRLEHKVKSFLYLNRLDYLQGENNELGTFEMKQLIEKIVLQMDALKPEISLQADLEDVCFVGDEEHWRVAIENIIENATRYAKSQIHITLKDKFLEIYNDGDHIDEETLPFLFDPYVKGVKGQFGLGLSIVSKIASMFSYDVKAVNQEVGVSFIFTKE